MPKKIHIFAPFAILACIGLTLSACSDNKQSLITSDISELQQVEANQAIGSPFSKNLAMGYKDFALWLEHDVNEDQDARHFGHKALFASKGREVLPEALHQWDINIDQRSAFISNRSQLLRLLDAGGRAMHPGLSAKAQISYDCWLERAEDNNSEIYHKGCEKTFRKALTKLGNSLMPGNLPSDILSRKNQNDLSAKVLEPLPTTPEDPQDKKLEQDKKIKEMTKTSLAPRDARYLAFFEFDSAEITQSAQKVLTAVAQKLRKNPRLDKLYLTGHADTMGPEKYNQNLGLRRAKAVKEAFEKKGVALDMDIKSMGETSLLVPTDDGVKEPANRRVEIEFVSPQDQ